MTLGYEYCAASTDHPDVDFFSNGIPHSEYWTVSFDFSETLAGDEPWPFGDDAVLAVTFYFTNGSVSDIGTVKASKTVCYPVFEVNGRPYVEDVICTPDLWPSECNAYPCYAEAVLYITVPSDTYDNGQE